MVSSKILTYRRKHLSSHPPDYDTSIEKLNQDNVHCSRCGSVDVNENLVVCDKCSGSYHVRCLEPSAKCIHEGHWRCSGCIDKHDNKESMDLQSKLINSKRENKNEGESEIPSVGLHSPEEILNVRRSGDRSTKEKKSYTDASYGKKKNSEPPDDLKKYSRKLSRVTGIGPSSRAHRDQEDVQKSSSVPLDSSTDMICNLGCSMDCASIPVTAEVNNQVCKVEPPKERICPPLITFHRRVKKKKNAVEATNMMISECKDKQSTFDTRSGYKSENNYKGGDSFPSGSIKGHPTNAVLAGPAGHSLQHEPPHEMPEVSKDTELESAPAEDCLLLKRTKDIFKEAHQSLHNLKGPDLASEIPVLFQPIHAFSNESTRFPTSDLTNESILSNQKNSVDLTNISISIKKDSESKLIAKGYLLHDLNISNPDALTVTSTQSNKKLMDILPENLLESQSSSNQNCARGSVDEETDDRIKELQWLESLDKELQETKKLRSSSSSCMENSQIKFRLASSRSASPSCPINASLNSHLNQDASRAGINQTTRSQEKIMLAKLGKSTDKYQHSTLATDHSSVCANSLGLYRSFIPEVPEASAKCPPSIPLPSSNLNVQEKIHQYDRHLQWYFSGENASFLRDKQALDNASVNSQIIKATESISSSKSKRFSAEWSEEELDILWIGVRRLGLNNWNAMLRDPKLCFLKSRVAEDLADQWDREQMKLFSTTSWKLERLSQPDQKHLLAKHDAYLAKSAGGHAGVHGACSGFSDFLKHKVETRLSLGDECEHVKGTPKQNQTQIFGLCIGNAPVSSSLQASIFESGYQNNLRPQRARYGGRSSHQNPVECQPFANEALPHWLKEVVNMSATTSSSTLPPVLSSFAPYMTTKDEQINTNAGKETSAHKAFHRRGILKRKSAISINSTGDLRIFNNSASMDGSNLQHRFDLLPNLGLTSQLPMSVNTGLSPSTAIYLNDRSSSPIKQCNVVAIESDASSEETISDHE